MSWLITYANPLPPQGTKVLCFTKGDVYVAQRFAKYWYPIPFTDSLFVDIQAPEMWKHISMPEGYTGKTTVRVDEMIVDIDTLQKLYPEEYYDLVKSFHDSYVSSRKV